MKIWSTEDWQSLPEEMRGTAYFHYRLCGRVYLYQRDDISPPVLIDPRWHPFQTVVEVLEFHEGRPYRVVPRLTEAQQKGP